MINIEVGIKGRYCHSRYNLPFLLMTYDFLTYLLLSVEFPCETSFPVKRVSLQNEFP